MEGRRRRRHPFQRSTRRTGGSLLRGRDRYCSIAGCAARAFCGQSVSVEAIEAFVLAETPFSASHYKKPVLRELEQAGMLTILTPRARRLTYPAGTKIRFRP